MNIEVEIRSFITQEKYEELLEFFKKEGEFVEEDYQETYYFDCPQDLRIQRNNNFSKIWFKKGELHDDFREELEIKFDRNDFEKLEQLFLALGFKVEIKWFRKRYIFKWQGVDVMIDYTKGYGYIIELEQKAIGENREIVLANLKEKLNTFNIPLTPKEEFEQRFQYYKEHWSELMNN